MTKTLSAVLATLLAFAGVSAPVAAQQAQPLDRIAAVVDEDVILQSELQRAVNNIKSQYAGREHQLPPQGVLERQVLERLVLVKLQVARAESSG
ncbi:MAG: SurA N-terminal domain-containing protein, partial [Stenotrophomonas nitritireducens]|nr:SurA N-terminal domain-containing protein [Stenotrophomonas nitritireducens]